MLITKHRRPLALPIPGPARLALVALAGVGLPWLFNQVDPGRDVNMDEALYIGWADHWAATSDWLFRHPLYTFIKPPFYPLLLGGVVRTFGDHRAALLLPNLLFGWATLYAVFSLAVAVGGALAGWTAIVLLATSGTWNFYVYSCFTDPGLALFTTVAALCAARGEWRRAGAAAAVAAGFKQFGLATLVLVPALALAAWGTSRRGATRGTRCREAFVGAAPVLVALVGWEFAGHHGFNSWLHGSPVPLGLSSLPVWVKLLTWARLLSVDGCLGAAGLIVGIAAALLPARRLVSAAPLAGFLAAYGLLLSLTTIPYTQRYLFWVLPLTAVVTAAGFARLGDRMTARHPGARGLVTALVLGTVMVAGNRSLQAVQEPIEMIRYGMVDFLKSAMPEIGPPAHLLIPIDVRWEVTGWLQQSGRYVSLECFSSADRYANDRILQQEHPVITFPGYGAWRRSLGEAVANNRHRDVYVLDVDERLLSAGWARTFALWNAGARRPPWRTWASRFGGYRYALVKVPRSAAWPPCPAGPLTPVRDGGWPFGARLSGLAVRRDGAAYRVTMAWTADRRPEADWLEFVELVDHAGRRLAYREVDPVGGTRPTSTWKPGEPIRECVDLETAAAAIRVGFVNPFVQRRALRVPGETPWVELRWRDVVRE